MKTCGNKKRADVILVEQGYYDSRASAQSSIMAGKVRTGPDQVVKKAGEKLDPDTKFTIAKSPSFVSRGALKLVPALDRHLPLVAKKIVLDLGVSTGGFTDLLLQRGASRVYAVDVGYGQLHLKLRDDPRVVCLEKTNARYLTGEQVPEKVDILTADLSFISLRKVLPAALSFLKAGAWIFVLIKPQFEAERCEVEKGGIVKSEEVRKRVVDGIKHFALCELGWLCVDVLATTPTRSRQNVEYLGVFRFSRGDHERKGCHTQPKSKSTGQKI